jgi:hypothetical protein
LSSGPLNLGQSEVIASSDSGEALARVVSLGVGFSWGSAS